ncbi:MAG: hypothetical protein ACLR78_04645 [Roseburia sp.]
MDAETPEFQIIEAEHNRIIANRYIVTCDEEASFGTSNSWESSPRQMIRWKTGFSDA